MSTVQRINEASGLIGLLLVFVFGYFAAVFPVALTLLETRRPDVSADRSAVAVRILSYAIIVGILLGLDLIVALWLTPLTLDTIRELSFEGEFPTIEVGLLVMDLFLISLFIASMWLLRKLQSRRRVMLTSAS